MSARAWLGFLRFSMPLPLVSLVFSIPIGAAPPRFVLEGFGPAGAVTHRVCQYRHPLFDYAWYPRPFEPHAIGRTVEYEGIVMEQGGHTGLAAYPGGFQPVRGALPMGAVVLVRGKLAEGRVHPYWTNVDLEASEVVVIHAPAAVAAHRASAVKVWQQTLASSTRDFSCRSKTRNNRFKRAPANLDFLINWESSEKAFLFSFSETAGHERSQLKRDFFLIYKPGNARFESVQGVCSFYEDLC